MNNETQLNTVKHSEEGNTSNSSSRDTRSRAWCFTLNNYTEDDIIFFTDTLNTEKYAFQEEICPTTGTPHLQGMIYFKNDRKFSDMKQLNRRAHWKKTICAKSSLVYCSDEGKQRPENARQFIKGFKVKKKLKLINENNLYPYQKTILNICSTEPDNRSIYWIWEPTGNVGKTSIIKLLLHKFKDNIHYCSGGKASDICYQINEMDEDCNIFLMNLPRSAEGKVSYNGIEQVKDGLTSSPKYKGGFKIFNPPHVFIFSNFPPDINEISKDKWKIFEIIDYKLIEEILE